MMTDGRGFAFFRLSHIVDRLWFDHVHHHRAPYSEFYRTLERYIHAKSALAKLAWEQPPSHESAS